MPESPNKNGRTPAGEKHDEQALRLQRKMLGREGVITDNRKPVRGIPEVGIAEKKQTVRRKARRILRTAFILFFCAVVTAGVIFAMTQLFFRVAKVSVSGNTYTDETVIAAALGDVEGVQLYSVDTDTAEKSILASSGYISSVKIKRVLPDKLEITVTEDTPTFYVRFSGRDYLLSTALRVLDSTGGEDIGAVKLLLPSVSRAVAGGKLELWDGDSGYITDVLQATVESGLWGSIDFMDFSDRYGIYLKTDGKYIIKLGDSTETATKLLVAEKVMEDASMQSAKSAVINVCDPREAIVTIDD